MKKTFLFFFMLGGCWLGLHAQAVSQKIATPIASFKTLLTDLDESQVALIQELYDRMETKLSFTAAKYGENAPIYLEKKANMAAYRDQRLMGILQSQQYSRFISYTKWANGAIDTNNLHKIGTPEEKAYYSQFATLPSLTF